MSSVTQSRGSHLENLPYPAIVEVLSHLEASCDELEHFPILARLASLSKYSRNDWKLGYFAQRKLNTSRILTDTNFNRVLTGSTEDTGETEDAAAERRVRVQDELKQVKHLIIHTLPEEDQVEHMWSDEAEAPAKFTSLQSVRIMKSVFRTLVATQIANILGGTANAEICVTPSIEWRFVDIDTDYDECSGFVRLIGQNNRMTFHLTCEAEWFGFLAWSKEAQSAGAMPLRRVRLIGGQRRGDQISTEERRTIQDIYGDLGEELYEQEDTSGSKDDEHEDELCEADRLRDFRSIAEALAEALKHQSSYKDATIEFVDPDKIVERFPKFDCGAEDIIRSAVFDIGIQDKSGKMQSIYSQLRPHMEAHQWDPAPTNLLSRLIFSYSDGSTTGRTQAKPCKVCGTFDGC